MGKSKAFKHEINYLRNYGYSKGRIREIFTFEERTYARVSAHLFEERVFHLHGFDAARRRPRWDGGARCLYVGYRYSRSYPARATNCIKVLTAFEQDEWRNDKLTRKALGLDSPEQLKKAVSSLKGGSRSPNGVRAPALKHITFIGDDGGNAIWWMLLEN